MQAGTSTIRSRGKLTAVSCVWSAERWTRIVTSLRLPSTSPASTWLPSSRSSLPDQQDVRPALDAPRCRHPATVVLVAEGDASAPRGRGADRDRRDATTPLTQHERPGRRRRAPEHADGAAAAAVDRGGRPPEGTATRGSVERPQACVLLGSRVRGRRRDDGSDVVGGWSTDDSACRVDRRVGKL